MLITRTSQYAIQALVYLATQEQGKPMFSHEIAERLQVPSAYLAKIMQDMAKAGLLTSFRGKQGGFHLAEDPAEIDLMRILTITERIDFTKACVLGLKTCNNETVCPMHRTWEPVKQKIIETLHQFTLEALSEELLADKVSHPRRLATVSFHTKPEAYQG